MVPNVTKVQTSCGKFFHGQSIENIATNRFPGLRSFGHPPTPDLHCMKESRGGGGESGGEGPEQLFLPPLSDRSFAAGTLPLPQGTTTPWR